MSRKIVLRPKIQKDIPLTPPTSLTPPTQVSLQESQITETVLKGNLKSNEKESIPEQSGDELGSSQNDPDESGMFPIGRQFINNYRETRVYLSAVEEVCTEVTRRCLQCNQLSPRAFELMEYLRCQMYQIFLHLKETGK
jgi:hypothetical protein